MAGSPPHVLLQPEVWGVGVVSIPAPLCVCARVCMCACVPAPGICLLSLGPAGLGLMSLAWRCPFMKDVTQRQAKGTFSLFSSLSGEEKGWPFPRGQPMAMWQPSLTRAGLCMTPKGGEEGCCHGGLCEANSSRVKWEIFIPRVRQRAGQRLRAGELGYYGRGEAVVCGQVGPWAGPGCLIPGSVSVSPPGWGEALCSPPPG